tara:strand:- start:143 stop:823 length:681 start_codon:yes stop_codon:yes gene_type:complete
MHRKIGKKIRLIFYILLIIILTSINNYNFEIQNIFKIKHIHVNGFSKEKNELVKNEFKKILEKNIFFISKNYFSKLSERNDTEYLFIKKKFPNKLIVNFIPAKPICIIEIKNNRLILGNNGKMLDTKINENIIPIVSGSMNVENIYDVVSLIDKSNLNYASIKKIVFFKSGRFDINLRNGVIIKFPVKFNKEIINYSNNLLNDKKFVNSKTIDLRIKNKIIKNEQL